MTGEEQQIEPDLDEEAVHTDSDQVVPNPQEERSMMATSAEVHVYTCTYILVFCLRLFKYLLLINGCFLCSVYEVQFVIFRHSRSSGLMQSTSLMKDPPFFSRHPNQRLKNTVSGILLRCVV